MLEFRKQLPLPRGRIPGSYSSWPPTMACQQGIKAWAETPSKVSLYGIAAIKSDRISVGDGSVSPYGSNTLTGYGNIPRYRLLIGTPPDDNSRLLARIIGELYSGLGSLKARACVNHVSPMTCSGFQPCLLEASAHCTQLTIDTYLDIQAEPHAKIYV